MVSPAEACLVQWAELWSRHDIDGLLAIFTDDCIYEDVTFAMISRGKIELRAFANQILAALPDFHIELKHHFVAGNWGAMEWVMSGTQEGNLPGMPATRRQFSLRGATVAELDGARIKRLSDYWDLAALRYQLGLHAR
jgi:steroid delta-isomerase-like uncharacterized protein